MALITVKNLSMKAKDKEILKNISFEINEGECLALIGPNGAGKTTLFKHLIGEYSATKENVALMEKSADDTSLKNYVAILDQENAIPDKLKVKELIEFYQSIYKNHLTSSEIDDILKFSDKQKSQLVSKLSGGQKRFLVFVLKLIGKPKILFLDEPTAAMDTATRIYFWQIVDSLKAKGTTIVYSSHYIEEVEHIAERILVLNKGVLVRDTTPYALKSEELLKYVSVPKDYLEVVETLDKVTDIEIKSDNISFATKDIEEVWQVLSNKGCKISEIEIQNRSLLSAIFEETGGRENE
ncbi:MAG: ABC transporter ATP-binding protein [Gemella sp.]|nr:ABC transporter ATP-binding protein [Gemella sp.]